MLGGLRFRWCSQLELQPPRRRNFHSTNQPATHDGDNGELCAKPWRLPTRYTVRSLVRETPTNQIISSAAAPPGYVHFTRSHKLTIAMIPASFPPFRVRRSSHNLRTLDSRSGPTRVKEQLNIHRFRDSSTRRRHSPLLALPRRHRILCSPRLNLLMMTCFLPGRNSPIDSMISETVDKGSVASSEPAASPKQATLTSFLLWAEMLLLSWLRIAEAR